MKTRTKAIVAVACIISIGALSNLYSAQRAEAETETLEIATEPTEINTYMQEIETEIARTETEIVKNETPEIATTIEKVIYYDVPLSHELQDFIFAECEEHNIPPAIIIAMIERESNYKSDALGDNGRSFGLMQIQPRWNRERMERLGCFDLMDPFQNIKVGIDLIAELKEKNSELEWVLMAYNGGESYANKHYKNGNISKYARGVIARAEELEESLIKDQERNK